MAGKAKALPSAVESGAPEEHHRFIATRLSARVVYEQLCCARGDAANRLNEHKIGPLPCEPLAEPVRGQYPVVPPSDLRHEPILRPRNSHQDRPAGRSSSTSKSAVEFKYDADRIKLMMTGGVISADEAEPDSTRHGILPMPNVQNDEGTGRPVRCPFGRYPLCS